jgi:putative heme-binding domain-containing protein
LSLPAGAQAPDDLARGKALFQGHCGLCHGQTGTGGTGPSLAQPKLHRAPDEMRLIEVIARGIPGTEMPGSWQLSTGEVLQLAKYVRSLGRIELVPLPGDAARGKTLYETKGGCKACHIIRGLGRSYGPELTEIGLRRNANYLRESLVKPAATVPEGFLMITAITRDGKTVSGIRMAEDSFTIQIRDASNKFHSFRKAALANLKKEFKTSPMPSYESQLSADELDDMVAYLASLRGAS